LRSRPTAFPLISPLNERDDTRDSASDALTQAARRATGS
jgi:hypothetical protein